MAPIRTPSDDSCTAPDSPAQYFPVVQWASPHLKIEQCTRVQINYFYPCLVSPSSQIFILPTSEATLSSLQNANTTLATFPPQTHEKSYVEWNVPPEIDIGQNITAVVRAEGGLWSFSEAATIVANAEGRQGQNCSLPASIDKASSFTISWFEILFVLVLFGACANGSEGRPRGARTVQASSNQTVSETAPVEPVQQQHTGSTEEFIVEHAQEVNLHSGEEPEEVQEHEFEEEEENQEEDKLLKSLD